MRTRKVSAPLLFATIAALSATACWLWLRAAETPPWREGDAPPSADSSDPHAPDGAKINTPLQPFTFITYNVKNWLVSSQAPVKPQAAKDAIVNLLASAKPDVIGLCEIGSKTDVAEIQSMLKAAGVDLPHAHHTGGEDNVRHLALISRFPIKSTASPDLRLQGMVNSMQRGILDATLEIGGSPVRFIGLHLKSKRTVPEFDEAELRLAEAAHVRRHIDGILAAEPGALLVAYGDFNDTTRSMSSRTIYGTYRTPGYMSPIHVKDSRGETWTHRYEVEDSYTRIDFVTVSTALRKHAKRGKSRILDDPLWETASDHRPVLVRFE